MLGAGDTEVTGHGSCPQEVLSLLVGPGKQADSGNPEFQDGETWGCGSTEQHQTGLRSEKPSWRRRLLSWDESAPEESKLHEGRDFVCFVHYCISDA